MKVAENILASIMAGLIAFVAMFSALYILGFITVIFYFYQINFIIPYNVTIEYIYLPILTAFIAGIQVFIIRSFSKK